MTKFTTQKKENKKENKFVYLHNFTLCKVPFSSHEGGPRNLQRGPIRVDDLWGPVTDVSDIYLYPSDRMKDGGFEPPIPIRPDLVQNPSVWMTDDGSGVRVTYTHPTG